MKLGGTCIKYEVLHKMTIVALSPVDYIHFVYIYIGDLLVIVKVIVNMFLTCDSHFLWQAYLQTGIKGENDVRLIMTKYDFLQGSHWYNHVQVRNTFVLTTARPKSIIIHVKFYMFSISDQLCEKQPYSPLE